MAGTSKMLTVADVCERLNVHEATVRRWIKARTLNATLLGGTVWRIPESEVERLITEGQKNTHAAELTDDLIRPVRKAIAYLSRFNKDLDEAMAIEADGLIDEYHEKQQEAKDTGKPIPESWFQAMGEQIADLCEKYDHHELLPDGWDNPMEAELTDDLFAEALAHARVRPLGRPRVSNAAELRSDGAVRYKFSRLCFKADIIEPLPDNGVFEVDTPAGLFRMTKSDFIAVFPGVRASKSYQEGRIYHYPQVPRRAEQFRV